MDGLGTIIAFCVVVSCLLLAPLLVVFGTVIYAVISTMF